MLRCNVGRLSLHLLRNGCQKNGKSMALETHAHASRSRLRFLSSHPTETFTDIDKVVSSRLPVFSKMGVGGSAASASPQEILSSQAAEAITLLQSPDGASLRIIMYLYDDKGSALFEEITKTPEYYLTNMELSILNENSDDIARFPDEPKMTNNVDSNNDNDNSGSTYTRHFQSLLIELGAGSGKKMRPILDATEHIPTSNINKYIPVDCSVGALDENINDYNNFDERGASMSVEPFLGTNEEALQELCLEDGRKTYLFLGSSMGNYDDPIPFMTEMRNIMGVQDRLLVGIDAAPGCPSTNKTVDVTTLAYNDSGGVNERFILNALSVANRIVRLNFDEDDWCLFCKYDRDEEAIQMYAKCTRPCDIHHTGQDGKHQLVRSFHPGDKILISQSRKYSETRMATLAEGANLLQTRVWSSQDGYYRLHEFCAGE